MSLEELIISAKELANSLKDDELKADLLINQTKNTHNQIEAMKKVNFNNDFKRAISIFFFYLYK